MNELEYEVAGFNAECMNMISIEMFQTFKREKGEVVGREAYQKDLI